MDNYSITDLSIAIVSIIGAIGSCLLVVQKSRCKTIKCCCIELVRDVPPIKENEIEDMVKDWNKT